MTTNANNSRPGQGMVTNGFSLSVTALLVVAILVQSGYQAFQLLEARGRLESQIQAQEATVDDAQKLRAQLLSIGTQTAVLARNGNENARLLIERLREQGVDIQPPAQ